MTRPHLIVHVLLGVVLAGSLAGVWVVSDVATAALVVVSGIAAVLVARLLVAGWWRLGDWLDSLPDPDLSTSDGVRREDQP